MSQCLDEGGRNAGESLVAGCIVLCGESVQGCEQAGDLLLADFAGAADPVSRYAAKFPLVDQRGRWLPLLVSIVEIELLQQGGRDEAPASAQDARSGRAADALAAAEDDEVGTLVDETAQIARRRKLRGGIDEYRDAGGVRDAHHGREWGTRIGSRKIENAGGALADGVLDFPRFGIAHAAGGQPIGKSHLDQTCSGSPHAMIVGVAVTAGHDELIAHPRGVGKFEPSWQRRIRRCTPRRRPEVPPSLRR